MAQQIVTPSAVVPGYPIGPYTLVGAASIQAALNDSSDSSYVQTDDSGGLQLGLLFTTPTPPTEGWLVRSLQIRMRRSVNTAALPQRDPFWWWRLEANDNGFFGTGIGVKHHDRVMGPELNPDLDGTTAIQTTTSSVISWFDDGEHVRNMRFGDARFIFLVWPTFLGGGPQMRLYKLELLVNYTSLPVATVTAPPDPVNSSKPTVTWTYSDADNDVQSRARVVIVKPGTISDGWPFGMPGQAGYQADQARSKAWDSGDIYTAGTSVDVPVGLTNGQQYYAYVRVWGPAAASTEQKSNWYYKIFTVTATGPATPTFTVTTDPANSRNLLTVQESSTSTPHPAYYEIERLDPGETVYTPVRNADQVGSYVGTKVTGTGVGWSTPDRSDFTFGTVLLATVKVKLTDYTPATACTLISKGRTSGNQREWLFRLRTDGKLEVQWSTAGTSYDKTLTSSVATGIADNTEIWFQVGLFPGVAQATFATSTDGVTFTNLGTTVSTTAGAMFGSTAPIDLGGLDAFTSEPPIGTVYEAKVFNSSLVLVAHPVIKGQPELTTSFLDETGNTWTYTSGANGYNQVELVVYDYEAPNGVAVTYEARSWRHDTDVVPSAWVTAAGGPWTLPATVWYLKDPLEPANNMVVTVVDMVETDAKQMTSSIPIGTSKGVVTHTGVRGAVLKTELRVLDSTAYVKLRELLTSGRTLLLQGVLGRQWYVQPGSAIPWEIIKAAPTESFPIRHAHSVTVDLIEVEAP